MAVGVGLTVFLSGCCGKLQSPYTCSQERNTCSQPQPQVKVVEKPVIIRKTRSSCEPYCCYAYGIDGRCISW